MARADRLTECEWDGARENQGVLIRHGHHCY